MSTQGQPYCSLQHPQQHSSLTVSLLSISKSCKALGIGKTKFYQLLKEDGTFPQPVAIGRSRLIRSDELTNWILSRPRANEPEAV